MARTSRRSAKKSRTVSVDFTGVEGKRPLIDEGTYLCAVNEVEQKEGDKADYFAWQFRVIEDDRGDTEFEDGKLYINTSLSKDSLWNLKGLLEALGEEVPDDELDIDLDEMPDKECLLIVEHEDYEGRTRAKVVDFSAAEEKKPASKGRDRKERAGKDEKEERGSSRSRRGSKDKEEDKVKQADVAEMAEDDLDELVKEHRLKVDLDEFKTLRKKQNAVIDALEKADLLDED